MTDYRLYLLGQTGRFENVQEMDCADDMAAIEMAEQRRSGAAAELWQLGRRVRTFECAAVWSPQPGARGGDCGGGRSGAANGN